MSGARLFRARPLPAGLEAFDAHVNALAPGVAAPDSFYSAAGFDEVVADPSGAGPDAGAGDAAPRFVGGCVCPPAGTDLLGASRALADTCTEDPARVPATPATWLPLLRLDAGAGPRPPAGTPSRVAARLGLGGRGGGREGAVGRAILEDPALLGRFAGVKLMPQQTGLPGPEVLDAIAASGRPVLVHAGIQCPPAWLERHLLARLGDAPVVLAHLGSWPCSADDLEVALGLVATDPRVHLETSGASIGNFVRHAAERAPERLLFGSNRPMCAPLVQLLHVAASIDDDRILAAVAAGNARRVFAGAGAPAGLPADGPADGPGRGPTDAAGAAPAPGAPA